MITGREVLYSSTFACSVVSAWQEMRLERDMRDRVERYSGPNSSWRWFPHRMVAEYRRLEPNSLCPNRYWAALIANAVFYILLVAEVVLVQ